ncbi:MAG: hypothetical protein MUC63_00965 [Planctomycetes bacterium]|nr:hypothetical protein [Planctomycetota bacterium]
MVCDFNVLGSALKTFGVAVASAADVSAAAAGTGSPIAVVGPPLTGSLKTMNPGMGAAGTLTIMLGPAHRPTGSVEPGRSASMMQIQLSASSLEGVVVQSLRFNGSGTGHEVDHVRGVSLCDDADGDGSPDPGAPLAGPVPFYWDDGTATFALSVAVNAGASRTLVLVYDFVAPIAAEGVTFQASLLTTADVTARGVTSYISVSPSLRPATPLSGPLVSIRHPPATEPAYFMGGCAAGPGPAGAPGALGLLLIAAGLAASLRALRRARR